MHRGTDIASSASVHLEHSALPAFVGLTLDTSALSSSSLLHLSTYPFSLRRLLLQHIEATDSRGTMSGTGGFYKYRCKYFFTHNCPNWTWVNHSACPTCLAEGRDEVAQMPSWVIPNDVVVPVIMDGILQYRLMDLIAPARPGDDWSLRDKSNRPPPSIPVTSAMPRTAGLVSAGI